MLENRGLIDVRGTATIFDDFEDPAERIENLGTIRKTAGTSSTIGVPLHNAGVVDGKVGELRVEDGTPEADTGTFTGTDAANRVVFVGKRTFTSAVQLTGFSEIADDITVKAGDTLTLAGTVAQRAGSADRQRHRHRPDQLGRRPPVRPGHHDRGRGRPDRRSRSWPGSAAARPSLDGERKLVNNGLLRLEQGADLSTFGEPRSTIDNAGRIELETPQRRHLRRVLRASPATRCCATPARSRRSAARSGSHLRLVVDNDGTINGPLELDSDSTVTHTGTFKDVKLGDGVLVTGAGADVPRARPRSRAASCGSRPR